jgi:hypothetical protein
MAGDTEATIYSAQSPRTLISRCRKNGFIQPPAIPHQCFPLAEPNQKWLLGAWEGQFSVFQLLGKQRRKWKSRHEQKLTPCI